MGTVHMEVLVDDIDIIIGLMHALGENRRCYNSLRPSSCRILPFLVWDNELNRFLRNLAVQARGLATEFRSLGSYGAI